MMSHGGGWAWAFSRLLAAEAGMSTVVPEGRERLEQARTLIHRCYDQPLDLSQVAGAAHLSRHHFVREFRRAFDLTPHQYMTQVRLERARELLMTTDRSVTEICMAVGFSSLGSFSTLFARHVGHSPARYRRRVVQSLGVPSPLPPIPGCFLAKFGVGRPG